MMNSRFVSRPPFFWKRSRSRRSGACPALRVWERVKGDAPRARDIDLCLIDWKMPDMDGVEVTRRIRREVGNDVPIVMISAYDISEVEEEARAAGVNGFLPKPLYRSSVYATIKAALGTKGSRLARERKSPSASRWRVSAC